MPTDAEPPTAEPPDDAAACECGHPECPSGVTYSHPFKLVPEWIGPETEDISAYLSVRTTSWEWEGERTDLHDMFSLLWAATLRCVDTASVQLVSFVFTLETEIYARQLVLRQEGELAKLRGRRSFYELLGASSHLMEELVTDAFGCSPRGNGDPDCVGATYEPEPEWVERVRRTLRLNKQDNYEFGMRPALGWSVFTSLPRGVTVATIEERAAERLRDAWNCFDPQIAEGVSRRLFRTPLLRNAVPNAALHRAERLLSFVDPDGVRDAMVIPTDSHLIVLGRRALVAVTAASGRDAFDAERLLVEERRAAEAEIFLGDSRCVWAETLDPSRFEALVREMLAAERGVLRVRQVGATRDRDGGRDLMAEWVVPPVSALVVGQGEQSSTERRQVIVQVKLRRRGVSKADLPDLRDTIEHYGCDGFLLVAFPRITSQLFDHLNQLRRGGRWWIDWWGQAEIEHRLRREPEIAARFPDLVRLERS